MDSSTPSDRKSGLTPRRRQPVVLQLLTAALVGTLAYIAPDRITGHTAGISDSASRPDPTEDERAAAFFQDYLLKCRPDEVRCVWFSNGRLRVGMIMTIDLRRETVFTAREVYNWASQSTEERRLTHSQVLSVRDVLDQLPASHNTEFRNSACISFDRNGRVKVCRYERIKAPDVVRRLYDLGGGYFDSGPS